MRVKLGMIITSASGKLGGAVIAKGPGSHYIKNQPAVSSPQTSRKQQVKSNTFQIAKSWRDLTDFQRQQWNTLAKSKPVVNAGSAQILSTGFSFYSATNQNSLIINRPLLTTPPIVGYVVPPLDLAFTITPTTFVLSFSNLTGATPAIRRVQLFSTLSTSPGVTNANSRLKMVPVSTTTFFNSTNIISQYSSVFGTPIVGSRVFIKLRQIDFTTRVGSSFVYLSSIVQAD